MKKFLSVITAIIMLSTCLTLTAFAQSDGMYEYTIKDDGTVEISAYLGSEAYLEIPSQIGNYAVSGIGESAFAENSSIVEVFIPQGVVSVSDYAFIACEALERVHIPSSVAEIGFGVFYACFCLEELIVDSDNEYYASVDGILFDKDISVLIQYPLNKSDSEYSLPSGVAEIFPYAFIYNKNLANIIISDSVTQIGEGAFSCCFSLQTIKLSDSLEEIGDDVFCECANLTEITLPESITSIGRGSFSNCESLERVVFSEGLVSIGQYAFSGCGNLVSVTIPSSVSYIGSNALGFDINGNAYDGFKIYGYSDSYAETYADAYNIDFISIGDAETVIGDANGDGVIDIFDYSMLKQYLSGGYLTQKELNSLDVNNDAAIDGFDLFYINLHINNLQLLVSA